MADLVPVLLFGALVVQIPAGILMYLDANRLGLKHPETYWFGVVIPAAEFVVILYYVSERENLPKPDPDDP